MIKDEIVFIWIGGLKFFTYEADGNKEGELIAANHEWNTANNTYGLANALGGFLVILGVLVALYKVAPLPSMIGQHAYFCNDPGHVILPDHHT